jgi:hypothetical protein
MAIRTIRGGAALTISPKNGLLIFPLTDAGPEELRVIECIESFQADLQRFGFFQAQIFHGGEIKVVDAGPVKGAPRRGAELVERREAEKRSIERGSAVARIGIDLKIAGSEVWRVDAIVIDAVGNAAEQGSVGMLSRVTGKPVVKRINPEICQPSVKRFVLRKSWPTERSRRKLPTKLWRMSKADKPRFSAASVGWISSAKLED